MNEEPKVSKRITRKLERYLNRERVEQRFDTSGQGVYRTHPIVVKLELAYLIANETQKKQKEQSQEQNANEDVKGRRPRHSKEPAELRLRSLPQKKTRVQMSEVNRLARNAHSTLKTIDADKISTVYRFRQQMVPYRVQHQGKVHQVSTSVHAMLNAEEAWRYRRENDEREKVRKYREQQKEKEKQRAAKEAREQELARLPPGIRMEIRKQNERQKNKPFLEKLLEASPRQTPRSSPTPRHSAVPAVATDNESADGEQSGYEDDFEEEEDVDDQAATEERVMHGDHGGGDRDSSNDGERISKSTEDGKDDEAFIAAVTTANEAGSIASLSASTYTSSSSSSSPSTQRVRPEDATGNEEEAAYADESFDTDNDDSDQSLTDDQSVFMTDVDPESLAGSRRNSRAPSPSKSSPHLPRINNEPTADSHGRGANPAEESGQRVYSEESQRPDSAKVRVLASQLARTSVRNAVREEGGSLSSSASSITSKVSSSSNRIPSAKKGNSQQKGHTEEKKLSEGKKTEEYTRTESVVSLSDRVKKDLQYDEGS